MKSIIAFNFYPLCGAITSIISLTVLISFSSIIFLSSFVVISDKSSIFVATKQSKRII
nr:MAG TPA_asm: hypothetical protein [Caudoviricetes sp.]